MTEKPNQEALERAAEAGWQEDSLRAHGRKRLIPWSEVDGRDREKWLGLASAIAAALPFSASLAERTRERDEALDAFRKSHARADAAEARVKVLTGLLDLYREAVSVDVKMEGPAFMGVNRSALQRAWEADRAALASSDADPESASIVRARLYAEKRTYPDNRTKEEWDVIAKASFARAAHLPED